MVAGYIKLAHFYKMVCLCACNPCELSLKTAVEAQFLTVFSTLCCCMM